jgi:hypothetical protein
VRRANQGAVEVWKQATSYWEIAFVLVCAFVLPDMVAA